MTPSREERRAHVRLNLTCPIVVIDSEGRELVRTQTLNISNGGLLLAPAEKPIDRGQSVQVNLRVPRSTENTFMFEDVSTVAKVLRHQRINGGDAPAMAFVQPVELDLEV